MLSNPCDVRNWRFGCVRLYIFVQFSVSLPKFGVDHLDLPRAVTMPARYSGRTNIYSAALVAHKRANEQDCRQDHYRREHRVGNFWKLIGNLADRRGAFSPTQLPRLAGCH
ncbi:hypothetical protein Y032_0035g3098 [Ancylostoma ceylanicum]|uniref:Uncharacterized protein n=1 Tax=Ancylostoma ceylanicum TaxID=53326 RepID=A0A016ULE1_9BILA|nr:hypothetical protein Y032_0035g3098 [Ancylostoma ceylanicum]